MSEAREVDVVVHTHWDREWYLAHTPSVARLLVVMDEVLALLESGQLQSFLFDGQTAAMEDLLAHAEPALAERARLQARAGRLLLGPWYVMADEFLVSGESLLRNLEIGLADATALGAAKGIGYLPDSFGHAAQMPALLRQFGIEHAVLWRGADAPSHLFDWVAPDDSVATTLFLPEGYYLPALNSQAGLDGLPALLGRIAARTPSGPLLLMHGGDHLAPSPALAQRLAQFNAAQGVYRLRPSTLAAHLQAALAAEASEAAEAAQSSVQRAGSSPPQRPRLHGELRHNSQAFVLPDVLSTRRPLKRAHQAAEDRLLGETEPLLAQLMPAGALPHRALEAAWRLLLQQQAHDSICGCSIDAVHTEMAQRFVQLGQRLDALLENALAAGGLVSRHQHGQADVFADDHHFTLFNPLPKQRQGWFAVSLFLHGPCHTALALHNAAGQPLPHVLLSSAAQTELVSPLDDAPQQLAGHRYELLVQAELPGLAALALWATPAAGAETAGPGAAPTSTTATTTASAPLTSPAAAQISNAHWQLGLDEQGQLRALDKGSGRPVERFLSLLSELDAGDSYNFSPPPQPHSVHQACFSLLACQAGPVVQELLLGLEMLLPAGLDAGRSGRSGDSVRLQAELRLRLVADEPALHLHLRWQQPACDHRLRLLLPWVLPAGSTPSDVKLPLAEPHSTWSDTAFAFTQRPARQVQIPASPSRREMPVVVQPSHSAISAGALALAHRALHEHQRVDLAGHSHLGLTLVRSVGWLSRRDLVTRGVGAGPDLATPGAQCLGKDEAELLLSWLAADEAPHLALGLAEQLRRPPLVLRGHGQAWGAPVDIGNPVLQTSAVRRTVQGALELRLWNPSAQPQPLMLAPQPQAGEWQAVHADGRDAGPLPAWVPPQGIVTLRRRAAPQTQRAPTTAAANVPSATGTAVARP